MGTGRGALYSGILHVAVLLLAWLGLPDFLRPPPVLEEKVVIVDIVDLGKAIKIAEKTNLPPIAQKSEEPKPAAKPEPK
ncbi:MAG: hypothetical protein HQL37_07330, partial [Alphaproteobacteria bacterium]|nr:hypothetical protein [Alphaproteobacteria bacterium]